MEKNNQRVLAIDWGGKRLGLAISDETRTLAKPYAVIQHVSQKDNARKILDISSQENVGKIIIGVTYSFDGALSPSGRSAERLKREMEILTKIPIVLFDETNSTLMAKNNHIKMGIAKQKRRGHLDGQAAAIILQAYLDEDQVNE